jgi:cation diffusion facilitator family transporter
VLAHSMALLADAGHNAGDVLALVLAWGSHAISQRHPTERYTYGFRSSSIIAALINATILLVVTGAIAWAALERLFAPQPVAGATVMVVAALAIVINGAAAAVLSRGNTGDLNVYGAFLHLVADAAVSAGVVIAGLVILSTGWLWVDPVASLVISGVIVWSTWGLLRDAAKMSLQGVPPQIDPGAVRVYLADEHHRDRADLPLGDAGRRSAARFSRSGLCRLAAALRHRPPDDPDRARRPAVQAVAGAYCLTDCLTVAPPRKSPRRTPARAFREFQPNERYAGRMATISNVFGSMIKS